MKTWTSLPTSAEFEKLACEARFVPIYRQVTADTLTPVTAWQRIATGPWSFLFESVVGGERVGRYSFVGSNPFLSLTARGNSVTIETRDGETRSIPNTDPLRELQSLLNDCPGVALPGLPGFLGGAVGFAGYDVIRYTENLPNVPSDDRGLPDLAFAFYDSMVVFDHIRKVIFVAALADLRHGDTEEARAARGRTPRRSLPTTRLHRR
ncbi:MAG UNVERIFIED_CONTAM: hypothetical protein LVR18_19490 [Planctomycetaceae bacterium]|jgi:anthranilate synthase component 1